MHLTSLQQQPAKCKLTRFDEQNPTASFITLNFFLRDIYKTITDTAFCFVI